MTNDIAIKDLVRGHYSKAAQSGCCGGESGSCCGSSGSSCTDSSPSSLYADEYLAGIPDEIAGATLGCGNPLALAALQPGQRVLDLGSGAGLDVLLAAQRVGPEGFVWGVDMTDEMLDRARRNAANVGSTNVAFLKGEIEALPLEDQTVDVILSNCVINLSPDKGQVLREAFRVLRPGGRLAVSDIVVEPNLDGLPVDEAQIRAGLSWVGCIAGAITASQYRHLLQDAGFENGNLDIQYRFGDTDLPTDLPSALAPLAPDVLKDLMNRFTSCSITAVKPKS
jgi:arsenite methyltransferase